MFRPFLPCGIAYGFAYALPMALPMAFHALFPAEGIPPGCLYCTISARCLSTGFGRISAAFAFFRRRGGAPVSGGDCSGVAGAAGVGGALRGACFVCRLPTLPLVFVFSPIPPPPFPGGEGGDQGYFHARGFAPCIPGAGWNTALALLVENRFFRLRMERWHPPGWREPGLQKAATAVHLYGRVYKCRKRFSAGVPGAKPPAK